MAEGERVAMLPHDHGRHARGDLESIGIHPGPPAWQAVIGSASWRSAWLIRQIAEFDAAKPIRRRRQTKDILCAPEAALEDASA